MKKKKILPVIIWALAIMVVSSIPNLSTPATRITFLDKIAHFTEYLILGILMANALSITTANPRSIFWISVILASIYGAVDEIHQLFIPGRFTDILDLTADIIGAMLGAGLYIRFRRGGRSLSR